MKLTESMQHEELEKKFTEIQMHLNSLRELEELDTYNLMSIEISKRTDMLIDDLIDITKKLIKLKSS